MPRPREVLKCLVLIGAVCLTVGCAAPQGPAGSPPIVYDPPPDAFERPDFMQIATDWIEDLQGRYVVFEGYYSGIVHDPPLYRGKRRKAAKDLRAFYVREAKHSKHYARVVYHDSQEAQVRPLEPLNRHRSQLQVFAYVLPSGVRPVLPSGRRLRAHGEPLLWLLRVEITFDDGIHVDPRP